MDYSFNADVAMRYGVEEAVFIHNLYWWIFKNRANGRHCYEGKSWTYNSAKAFAELFPFWSEKKIDRMIKKLEECGALHVGNFNPSSYDRTRWFALDESVLSIYENREIHSPKTGNGSPENGEPIPDSKPDINTDSSCSGYARAQKTSEPMEEDEQVRELSDHYQQNGGVARGDVLDSIRFYLRQGLEPAVIHEAIRKGGLNNKRWPYIDGILRNWNNDGIRIMAQLEAEQARIRAPSVPLQSDNPFLRLLPESVP